MKYRVVRAVIMGVRKSYAVKNSVTVKYTAMEHKDDLLRGHF